MSKNNAEERKCKICGKTIVGRNKTGICSACRKKTSDTVFKALVALGFVGTAARSLVKVFIKKD